VTLGRTPTNVPGSAFGPKEALAMTDARLLQPGEGRSFPMGPDPVTVLLEAAATGGAFSMIEAQLSPGIPGPPPHIHHDRLAEIWYVLDGDLEFLVGDRTIRASRGASAHIPPETLHTFSNVGDTPARWVGIFSPANGLDMLEELAPAFPPEGMPDVELMGRIFAKYHVEVVGDPPPA
jgi:mannose-6-phosphate isomerase-like protein (cupin superfamily)